MDFGATLKAAREARGLTTSQLAAQTRILVQTIEGMERNDFKKIPAPIYGRGFVKLICECLDLDPVFMVPAFMSAYNGEPQIPDDTPIARGIRYAEKEEPPMAPPVEVTSTEPPAAQPPVAESSEAPPRAAGFDFATPAVEPPPPQAEEPKAAEPAQENVEAYPPKTSIDSSLKGLELFDPSAVSPQPSQPSQKQPEAAGGFSNVPTAAKDDRGFSRFAPPSSDDDFSRFATPMPEDDTPSVSPMDRFRASLSSVSSGVLGQVKKIPRPAVRMSILAIGALLVLALCGWGIAALFRATSEIPENDPANASAAGGAKSEQAAAAEQKNANTPKKQTTEQPPAQAPADPTTPTRSTVPLKLPGFYID